MATDAHCHVFGPAATFPYAPGRAYTPADAPKQRLAELHKALGIERAVIVQASCHGTDNRAMLDAIAAGGGRRRGIAIVDDSFSEKDYDALHEGGIRGVRFNFVKHLGGMPDLRVFHHVLQRIRPLGWHLVVHLDAADIVELSGLLRGLSLPFVIDHMGRVQAGCGPAAGAVPRAARSDAARHLLGESVRLGARIHRGPSLSRRDPLRAGRSFRRRRTASCGARTGPTRTSAARCRTMRTW